MINFPFLSNTFFERSVCKHPEQYEDRKRYINAIKSSFSTSGQPLNANEQGGDNNRSEKVPHSFLGVRFFLALCLFLAFFAIKQTDTSWKGWDAKKITRQLQSTMDVSGISDWFKILP